MEDDKLQPSSNSVVIVLRELEAILQRRFGNSLIVESFETSGLLSSGDSYGSTMLRVDTVVRYHGKNSEPEELSLVAKMVPAKEFGKIMFNSPLTFRKEIYMLKEIAPAYRDLELEYGIPEVDVFDPLPKFFGSRLSLEEAEDKFDDDAVILMENLKLKNYVCGDRKIGYDVAHAKFAVVALARFHAIGFAVKIKKPEIFEEFKIRAKHVTLVEKFFAKSISFVINNLKKTPALLPHMTRIEKVLCRSDSDYCKLNTVVEPWGTISHGDFWINNIMFRDDASGDPEDVKFVDFQEYVYHNPMRDLVYFLFTSCATEVRVSHVEDLFDMYYKTLLFQLAKLQCDVNSFSRDSFNERLAVAANLEYFQCMLVSKLVTVDVKTDPVDKTSSIFQVEASKECIQRMAEITLKFLKENWI